jgi:hypothetical protein
LQALIVEVETSVVKDDSKKSEEQEKKEAEKSEIEETKRMATLEKDWR